MNQDLQQRAKAIKLAIFDVDGVLTDGRLYFLTDGSEFKTFNTLDGQGIKMLINSGVRTAIISGRSTPVVEKRANNLGIQHLYQGREDKLVVLDELLAELGLNYAQVAYLGDDITDIPVIKRVGLGCATGNAWPHAQQAAGQIPRRNENVIFLAQTRTFRVGQRPYASKYSFVLDIISNAERSLGHEIRRSFFGRENSFFEN